MTSDDLVERLRDHEVSRHHGGCQDCYGCLMDDAADEIERLRNQLAALPDDKRASEDEIERLTWLAANKNGALNEAMAEVERLRSVMAKAADFLQEHSERITKVLARDDWTARKSHVEADRNSFVAAENALRCALLPPSREPRPAAAAPASSEEE